MYFWLLAGAAGAGSFTRAATDRAQAATALNRVLGRDASRTAVPDGTNPFSDLPADHWACANVLEAAGALPEMPEGIVAVPEDALPRETDAAFSAPPQRAGPSAAHRCAAPPTAGTPGAPWDSP